jgi:hypothetical protein
MVIYYGWAVQHEAHPATPTVLEFLECELSTLVSHVASILLVDIFPYVSSSVYAAGQTMKYGLGALSAAIIQPLVDHI